MGEAISQSQQPEGRSITDEQYAEAENEPSQIPEVTVGQLYALRSAEKQEQRPQSIVKKTNSKESMGLVTTTRIYDYFTRQTEDYLVLGSDLLEELHGPGRGGSGEHFTTLYYLPRSVATPQVSEILNKDFTDRRIGYYLGPQIKGQYRGSSPDRIFVNGLTIDGSLTFYETPEESQIRYTDSQLKEKSLNKSKKSDLLEEKASLIKTLQAKARKDRHE